MNRGSQETLCRVVENDVTLTRLRIGGNTRYDGVFSSTSGDMTFLDLVHASGRILI